MKKITSTTLLFVAIVFGATCVAKADYNQMVYGFEKANGNGNDGKPEAYQNFKLVATEFDGGVRFDFTNTNPYGVVDVKKNTKSSEPAIIIGNFAPVFEGINNIVVDGSSLSSLGKQSLVDYTKLAEVKDEIDRSALEIDSAYRVDFNYDKNKPIFSTFSWTLNYKDQSAANNWETFVASDFFFFLKLDGLQDASSKLITGAGSLIAAEADATASSNNATPEPATLLIFGLGFAGAGFIARRKNAR